MAQYTFQLVDKEEPIGTPDYVWVDLTDPFIGANTWAITAANNWIGTGSGEYRTVGDTLELRDGSWDDERTRLVLQNINYPGDLTASGANYKRGSGQYVSEPRQISGAMCEWIGRNIAPDPDQR